MRRGLREEVNLSELAHWTWGHIPRSRGPKEDEAVRADCKRREMRKKHTI